MATESGDLDDTIIRLVEPAPPIARPLPGGGESGPEPTVQWSVRVRGTSTVVALDRPVDIGRNPSLSRIDEHPAPRRVAIPADRGEVSARHVRVEQVGETLVVHDLGSTNGVVVHWASGASRRLRRGESIAVLSDAVIALADGVELDFVSEGDPTSG
ncbi:FHA domain-containing protein [Microcella sp.]|uniref:FHA domain-containing protein n=1 Tax=Microcella sp. TaxID=1913979 RepID=UPI00256A4D60|nr:FHA domain-containing protein [Microcella sp.]MBX9471150.1 FHA domain-containing protein [Microcella sp.]